MSWKKIECLCVVGAAGRLYPVDPGARGDARFTREMVKEVGDVLASHGFPPIEESSEDFYALMWVLVRFCWGTPCGTAGRTVLR